MDPITIIMGLVAIGSAIYSGVTSANQSKTEKAAQEQAEENALVREEIAKANAQLAQDQGADILLSAEERMMAMEEQKEIFLGSQKAAVGATGMAMTGSMADVIAENMKTMNSDISQVGVNAQNQADYLQQQADIYSMEGESYADNAQYHADLAGDINPILDGFMSGLSTGVTTFFGMGGMDLFRSNAAATAGTAAASGAAGGATLGTNSVGGSGGGLLQPNNLQRGIQKNGGRILKPFETW